MFKRQNIIIAVLIALFFVGFIMPRYGERGLELGLIIAVMIAGVFVWNFAVQRWPRLGQLLNTLWAVFLVGCLLLGVFGIVVASVGGKLPIGTSLSVLAPILILVGWFVVQFYWGAILQRFGRADLAEQHYSNLIRINSGYTLGYMNRGWMRHQRGDDSGALKDYTKALELADAKAAQKTSSGVSVNFDVGTVYVNRATIYFRQGAYEAAIAECNAGLSRPNLQPLTQSVLRYNRSTAYLASNQFEAALVDLDYLISEKQDARFQQGLGEQLHFCKALTLYGLDRVPEAAAEWNALVARNPKYQDMGWIRQQFKWPEMIYEMTEKVIESSRHSG